MALVDLSAVYFFHFMNNSENQTVGQSRVRASFNPSENPSVSKIKALAAELIDFCEGLKTLDPRLAAIAQTNFETGAMYAVKLVTTPTKVEEAKPEAENKPEGEVAGGSTTAEDQQNADTTADKPAE